MNLEEEIKKIVESTGAKLYDIESVTERGKNIYRIIITHKDGVDLDLCAQISNMVSPLLDVNPPIRGDYNLEVSSPGIERKLKKLSHFKNSIGELVKIVTHDGNQIKGKLSKVEENSICLDTEHGQECIDFDDIATAKTYFEW